MATKAPANRRKFANPWDQVDYLYHKLLYWLYERSQARKALPYADRLEKLLARASPGDEAIWPEECRSLICEARGDLPGAIRHREKEVRLIRRLQKISVSTPSWDYIRECYDYSDLSDRLDLLAILYHDSGERKRAIRVLKESKEFCDSHGIAFDGQGLLDDYLKERDSETERGIPAAAAKGRRRADYRGRPWLFTKSG